jgi:hypothetical protein
MPITIKEILNSDNMSGFVEKVNFNFDQLLLAGGGPPGPPGIQGIPGPVGVQGKRGDHWFTGASAFGQTADHGGTGALQIQDNFLDANGDVYNYFDLGGGSTGWTFSGINLMGPTGPTGLSGGGGGGWDLYLKESPIGGAVGGAGYFGPKPITTPGTLDMDFLIPDSIKKNSVFLGDPTWSYDRLINFGWNWNTGAADSTGTPKLTIIQNNMNIGGFNGLAFGGYGLDTSPGTPAYYTSDVDTTDASDFTYLGYKQNPLGSAYRSWFGMRALNAPIEINVGDPSFTYTGGPSLMPFRLTANNIKIASYEVGDNNAKVMEMYEDYGFNISGLFQNIVRGMSIHAKPTISAPPIGPNWTPTDNSSIYGYIGLQALEGAIGSTDGSYGQEHAYGTVIIGPTYNTNQGSMIGVPTPQALGISRRITQGGSRDAAIRFMFDGVKGTTAGNVFSTTIGTIVPMRLFSENLDALVISAGVGSGLMGNRLVGSGGRIGISNNALSAFIPQFPSHTSITWDGQVFGGAMGTSPTVGDPNNPWYAGFDYKHKTNPFLLGTTSFQPRNDVGIGFATVAENFNAPSGLTGGYYPMPWIQTYYVEGYDEVPNDGMAGRSQGINAPHLFMQYGPETTSGNIGIGFKPDTVVSSAFSKLSIAGSVTIGSTSGLYHTFGAIRRPNSILLEGALIQGAVNYINQYDTTIFGSTATANAYANNYTISGNGLIAGRIFLSRGFNGVTFAPDYALPDLKTGMQYDFNTGNEYIGWLTSPRNLPASVGGPTAPDTATTPKKVVKWANRGENGYNNNNDYSSFSVLETFSTKPVTLTAQDLTQKLTNVVFGSGGGAPTLQCSTWEIPVRSSMIFLDLALGRTGMMRYTGSWGSQAGSTPYFLNGFVDPPSSANIQTRPVGFSLEDGHFDGQTLHLVVLDVNVFNTGPLLPNRPPWNGSLPQVLAPSAFNSDDNIVMAPEPHTRNEQLAPSVSNLQMPLASTRVNIYGNNDAYPIPMGAPGPSSVYTAAQTTGTLNALRDEINNQALKWTNRSKSGSSFSSPATPGGPVWGAFNGVGYGTFYIIPYRSIRFVWRFNSSSGTEGKWWELGRENLVRPLSRSWNPGDWTQINDPADPGSGDDPDPDPIDPIDPLCCFVAGTLISMADGTFKAIEDIKEGDIILSVLDGTQEIIENGIRATVEVERSELYTVTLDNGNTFTITDDHPVWVEGKGWSSVDPTRSEISYPGIVLIGSEVLSVGDVLFGIEDKPKIISIVDAGLRNESVYTIGTTNKNAQNYFANGILSHNVKIIYDPNNNLPQNVDECLAPIGFP